MVPRHEAGGIHDESRFRVRLSEAAAAINRPLAPEALDKMSLHYRLLRDWSRRMNLTGIKDEGAIIRRHFIEPIAIAGLIGDGGVLVDLGSGNGFPAIPLAVLRPGVQLVLVEQSEKKSAFLWTVLRELGLKGARVETRRACRRADLGDLLPSRWMTFRALRVESILESGPPPRLLEDGGRLLAFVSEADSRSLCEDLPPDLRWVENHVLPGSSGDVVALFESQPPA